MFCRRFIFAALVAAVGVFVAPATSQGAFTVRVQSSLGGDTTFVSGNGQDLNGATVTFNNVQITINASNNNPGSPGVGTLSTQTIDVIAVRGTVAAQTLTITTSADGFTTNPSPLTIHTEIPKSKLLGSASGYSMVDGTKVTNSDVVIGGTEATDVSVTPAGSPFNLGNVLTINLNKASGVSNTSLANVTLETDAIPAPAPAGLILLAGVVPFVGLIRRRLKGTPAGEEGGATVAA